MKDSKLIDVVKHLNKHQITHIIKMIRSPFYNSKEELFDLFEYLTSNLNVFSDDTIFSKQNVFSAIFPNEKYNEKKLAYAQSNLLKIIEEYLVWEELETRDNLKSSLLMRKLNQFELNKMFNSTLKRTIKQMQKTPHRNGVYFLDAYLIKRQENDFIYKTDPKNFNKSITDALRELDIFYKAEQVRYLCAIVNRNIHMSESFDIEMLEETIQDITKNDFYNEPVIQIYGSILLGLVYPKEEFHFKRLRELIIANIDSFPQTEVRDQYVYAINYCVRRANSGDKKYFNEMFKLFKILLNNEIILEKGKISHHEYLNIVSVAVQQKQYSWAHRFIDDYKKNLEKHIAETAFNYNKSFILFAEQDFEKAHKTLNKVKFNDLFYTLKTKLLLLKLYYEANDFDLLRNQAESFRVYVRRNSHIDPKRKKLYMESISALLKLSKVKFATRKKIKTLENKVIENSMIDKSWILEKIRESKLRTQ